MNFYTKNSSSSCFFAATFSRVVLEVAVSFPRDGNPFAGESLLGCMWNVFEILFPYETFFRSEVPAYAADLCSLVTAKYEYLTDNRFDWDMSYYLTWNDVGNVGALIVVRCYHSAPRVLYSQWWVSL